MRTAVLATVALALLGGAGVAALQKPEWVAQARNSIAAMTGAAPRDEAGRAGAPKAASAPDGGRRGASGPQQMPVEVARARSLATTTDILSIGSLQSDEAVTVSSEVTGRIAAIHFAEGARVRTGDLLVSLDDALTKAEITDAEARLALARANFDRAATLAKSGNVTDKVRDETQAGLGIARAALELAKVKLSKLAIQAPFSGTVGLRKMSVGAFVNPGAAIVNLEKIDELKLDFKVPEVFLSRVRVGQEVEVAVDALPNRVFQGKIYAVNPLVDVNGRALQVRAKLGNPDMLLRPGLFARITIKGDAERQAVFVPESAILPRGSDVYVFKVEDGKAVETKVSLGARKAGEVEITKGLSAADVVIVAGQTRVRNGALVEVIQSAASRS